MPDDSRSRSDVPHVDVPDQDDAPLVWDAKRRAFVERSGDESGDRSGRATRDDEEGRGSGPGRSSVVSRSSGDATSAAPATSEQAPHAALVGGKRDQRRYFVPPSAVGKAPPGGQRAGSEQPSAAHDPAASPEPALSPLRPQRGGAGLRTLDKAPARPQPGAPGHPGGPGGPGQPGGPSGPGVPSTPAPARKRRFRLRWRWVVLVAVLLPILLLAGGLFWANSKFSQIERVDVAAVLDSGGSGTNYLIVGSDSREGIGSDDPNAGAILGPGEPAGQRSDTIMLLRIEKGRSLMLSIPRDLFVTIAETGSRQRINAAYNGGPSRLIQTVKDNLGIPINRYLEVDFVTFAGLVDAVGGVQINFPNPATDDQSGLNVQATGLVELDGSQALAYVRSRHYTEIIDGKAHTDPTADLGRVQRQQQFLRAVLAKAGKSKNPLTLMRIGSSVVGGLRIDNKMSLFDAIRFAWDMGKLNPESVVLPTEPFRTNGGAAVLRLKEAEAESVLAQFQ